MKRGCCRKAGPRPFPGRSGWSRLTSRQISEVFDRAKHWEPGRLTARSHSWRSGDTPKTLVLMALVALLAGMVYPRSSFAAPKPVLQRSWLGGEYKLAKRPAMFQSRDTIVAFPNSLRDQQRGGVLITALETNTPAALGGLRAGDLILKVNDQAVAKLGTFFKFISAAQPGHIVQLSAYRDGEILDFPVTLGRETYQKEGTVALGLLLSGDWEPLPKPDFSLVALGYKRRMQRLELYSPETRYRMRVAFGGAPGASANRGVASSEGWEAWCVILSVSSRKRILSQETIPSHPAETAFASLAVH